MQLCKKIAKFVAAINPGNLSGIATIGLVDAHESAIWLFRAVPG